MKWHGRGLTKKIMAAAGGAAAVAIAVEAAIRLLGVAPPKPKAYQDSIYVPDAFLPYRQRPLIARNERSSSGEFREVFQHNSAGFRDGEHALPKPANTFRILGLGGSITYGSGTPFPETYLSTLEARLNRLHRGKPAIEIIKAGVGGFFPQAERQLLQRYGLPYQPDLLLVAFDRDDLLESYLGEREYKLSDGLLKTSEFRELGRLRTFLAVHTHVGRILYRRWSAGRRARQFRDFLGHQEQAWALALEELTQMRSEMAKIGGRVLVCHIPLSQDQGSQDAARLRNYCLACGMVFVDAAPAMARAAAAGPVYWQKDRHCTPLGHRAIADALFEAMVTNGVIERPPPAPPRPN